MVNNSAGAIHNGRVRMEQIATEYTFYSGSLTLTHSQEWQELRQCFEHMATELSRDETWGREQAQAAWASLRMIRDAIQELFGPIASVDSEEAVICVTKGPELHHEAEALIEALKRVKTRLTEVADDLREEAARRDDERWEL